MARKGSSFWDNPFGGMFDFIRDGREDFGKQWLAFKIFEECTKRNNSSSDDHFNFSHKRHNYAMLDDGSNYDHSQDWRDFCSDGSDVGLNPYDFASEEEYEAALAETRVPAPEPITLTINVEIPGMKALNAISPKDYPNKRKYDAAYHLYDVRQGTAYISDNTTPEAEIVRCRFILDSDTVAARYLTVFNGFLYAQAVKEHFALPVEIPDEDDTIKTYWDDLMREVAEEDPELAVEIWGWCIKQFGPYPQYMRDRRTLYNFTMCSIRDYPEEFLDFAAQSIGSDLEFCDRLLTGSPEFPACCAPFIAKSLEMGMSKEAALMFIAAVLNPAGKGKDFEELIEQIIAHCSDWETLETMESFQTNILPIVQKMDNKRIIRLYPQFVKKVEDYIRYVETSCERYRYSRRYVWRNHCADGSAYGVDPIDYETEQEYNQAIYDEKYAWRSWASYDGNKYGIDPMTFECEDDFDAAVEEARVIALQKKRAAQPSRKNYSEPMDQTDKNVYTFCGVMFEGSNTLYYYRTNDDTIAVGDLVVVPTGRDRKDVVVEVLTVQKHRRATAPYPVDRTRFIKRKHCL